MSQNKITRRQQEILDAIQAEGGVSAAAKKLGLAHSTVSEAAKIAHRRLNPETNVEQPLESEPFARAQIRKLEKQLLNECFVKREIFKLADAVITPPEWITRHCCGSKVMGVPTLLCSDWHWGEKVASAQINGINQYTMEIAQARAKELISKTIFLLRECFYSGAEYPGIVMALAGDMVSGDIHEELSATNEAEIMPAVIDIVGVLVWCIRTLADEFGKVFCPCVTGNHGRNTKKIRHKGRAFTSFDWLIYQMLRMQFQYDPRVAFLIPDSMDAHYRIYDHRYSLSHGDDFKTGDSMIGPIGPITRGDHKKRARDAQIGLSYDTMLIGHFHSYMQLNRFIVNGSLVGYNEYAYNGKFGYEQPQQALWITHPKHHITFPMTVRVETPELKESRNWISVLE